jgi:hypothetical protein
LLTQRNTEEHKVQCEKSKMRNREKKGLLGPVKS